MKMKGDSNSSSCAGRSRAPVSPRGIARLVLLARCVRAWKDAVLIVQQAIPRGTPKPIGRAKRPT